MRVFPSFEEGRTRRSNNVSLPQEIGAAGEVRRPLQAWSDLPRRADSKVALHLLNRRGTPSSKEGIGSSRYQPILQVLQQTRLRSGLICNCELLTATNTLRATGHL